LSSLTLPEHTAGREAAVSNAVGSPEGAASRERASRIALVLPPCHTPKTLRSIFQLIHEDGITQQSLHENIAVIPQDASLFHRTLMENIRYGRLAATDEEVITASKQAHCHEFIEQLEEQYQSLVGERGIRLSGGQRQRIAIARALLKNAPILILDEATSSLDSATEKKIQESLQLLMKNRTTIVIAHRLSTLLAMDRILVFHEGKIVEDGTIPSLLERGGRFATLWKIQQEGTMAS
jgi:ATP-binding cassette subfamily B protein